jgi:carotenoid 1,2-hydratase
MRFDAPVRPRGYRWFYLDAVSDDGNHALVVIAMLGSPFSPAYARARSRGATNPLDFSAFNVSVSGTSASRWALTERKSSAVARDASSLSIGASTMRWLPNGALEIWVDERSAPWGARIRGRILFHPELRTSEAVAIDGRGEHLWWPVAPFGRVEVELRDPSVRFSGKAYLDSNAGDGPLEESFASWSWARLSGEHEVSITYDVVTQHGSAIRHGVEVDRDGVRPLVASESARLGMTRFGLSRTMRSPWGAEAKLVRTVEDGPFYARSIVQCEEPGRSPVRGVHEVVSLDRFASSWVQFLIPFRMRREAA